jgi:hypothetical protein
MVKFGVEGQGYCLFEVGLLSQNYLLDLRQPAYNLILHPEQGCSGGAKLSGGARS